MPSGTVSLSRTFMIEPTHHHTCLSFSSQSILTDYSKYSTNISLVSPQTSIINSSLSPYPQSIMISHTMINLLDNPDQSTIQNCMINDSTWSHFQAELVPCIVVVLLVYMDGKREKRVILQYGTGGCGRGEERREEGGRLWSIGLKSCWWMGCRQCRVLVRVFGDGCMAAAGGALVEVGGLCSENREWQFWGRIPCFMATLALFGSF